MLRARKFRICPHIAPKVNDPNFVKFLGDDFAKSIESPAVDKAAVGDESQNAVFVEPIAAQRKNRAYIS